MLIPNDCQSCGACCSGAKRQWVTVTEEDAKLIDPKYLEEGRRDKYAMQTQKDYPFNCVALQGNIGEAVSCSIYENRPEVCRKLERGSDRCERMVIFWFSQQDEAIKELYKAAAEMQDIQDEEKAYIELQKVVKEFRDGDV